MAEFLIIAMGVSAVIYVTLGGADFGAGMVEPLLPEEDRERMAAAIAPVWEANHVWLVLVAVLAFVGFPALYVDVSIYLHVPVLFILLGIVARGSAFTFRHYDPEPGLLAPLYSVVFRLSSFSTPLFLGIVVAAMVDGRIGVCEGGTFYECYIAPWNTLFGWATGLFLCCLFAFEGAALLAAEHAPEDEGGLPYMELSRRLHIATMLSGFLVFVAAWATDSPWFADFTNSSIGILAVLFATAMVPVVALSFHANRPQLLRFSLGLQTSAILLGFFVPTFPVLLRLRGDDVVFPDAAASDAVLFQLTIAVTIGLCVILPGLMYLIAVYKRRSIRKREI